MQKRKFDELVSYFNKKVSEMEIETKYKMELLGMVTALGYANEKETHEERTETHACDLISKAMVCDILADIYPTDGEKVVEVKRVDEAYEKILQLPSTQPFHNTTMNDVLEYIDDMPEDVWLEFTACLECRGWELQRRIAKWCGGDFT